MSAETPVDLADRSAWPKGMRDLVTDLESACWRVQVGSGVDTGDNPWLTVEAVDPTAPINSVRVTWHTRGTGTYRLFTCIFRRPYRGWADSSLRQVRAFVSEAGGG